jgi:hypothetical protein
MLAKINNDADCDWIVELMDGPYMDDKEIILQAVAKKSFILWYASERLKNDKDVMMVAAETRDRVSTYTYSEPEPDLDMDLVCENGEWKVKMYIR